MDDLKKNKKQLVEELNILRERISRAESANKNVPADEGVKGIEFLETIIGAASAGIFVLDEDVNYVLINPACGTIMGQNPGDWINRRAGTSLHPDDRDNVSKIFYQVLEGRAFNYELRLKASDDKYRILSINLLPLNHAGKKYAMGVVTDISDRKQAESNLKYRLDFENLITTISTHFISLPTDQMEDAINRALKTIGEFANVDRSYIFQILDPTKRFMTNTHEWCFEGIPSHIRKLQNLPVESFKWMRDKIRRGEVVHIPRVADLPKEAEAEKQEFELEKIKSVILAPMFSGGRIIGFIGFDSVREEKEWPPEIISLLKIVGEIFANALARKHAEEELRESEERYKSLFNSVFEGVAIHENGVLLDVNQSLANMLGYKISEMIGQSAFKYFAPQEKDEIEWRLKEKTDGAYENMGLKKDGTAMIGEIIGKTINYKGRPARLVAIRDISEAKRAMNTIKESLELYKTLVEMSPDAIALSDLNGRVIMANKSSLRLFGYEKDFETNGLEGFKFIASKDRQRALENMLITLQKGANSGIEYTFIKKDGSTFIGDLSVSTLYDANGSPKGFIVVIRDMTERRKMEEDLLRGKKLESIGILAGGIAHDFNNILTAILGNVSLARLYGDMNEKLNKCLSEAEKSCLRARDLTQQLLTFSKGGAPIKKTASIAELLKDTAEFTASGSNVRCEFYIPENLYSAEVDEGQISQVINNLIINAIQATPQGGVVKISADNTSIDNSDVAPVSGGDYVRISIKDHGVGISKEHLPKIFDPYFSTKQKGSGLGLAIAYSIVRKHEGYIHAESELGNGATFTFYLPASKKEKPSKIEIESEKTISGKGKILLMDDEEIIRHVGGETLDHMGYEVEFARDGSEAIEKYKKAMKNGSPFDAVIMDLTIVGGMGGQEAIQKLVEIDPDVKAIVSSGYSNDPVMANYREYGFKGVISKPYEIRELGKVIHDVLRE